MATLKQKSVTPKDDHKITTSALAKMLGCKPDTIRRSLCTKGHYLGLRPVKLPNGRLLWSEEPAVKIINGEVS